MNLRGMTIFTMLSLPVHELGIIFPFISFVVVVVVVLCCCLVAKSRLALGAPWTVACQGPGVGCHFLLQGIFPTEGWNPSLQHRRQILYH